LEEDEIHARLLKAKLHKDEFAVWRDQFMLDLQPVAEFLAEAELRLDAIVDECLIADAEDNTLLDRLLHAARAHTLLYTLEDADAEST